MLTKITLAAAALTIGFSASAMAAPFNGPFGAQPKPAPVVQKPIAQKPIAHPGFGQPTYGQPAPFAKGYTRPGPWQLVGQRLVDQRLKRDAIPVAGRQTHQQIMICAYNRPVRLNDVDVRFGNGGAQDVAVRNVLQPGTCTRAIDLQGNRRDIRTVTLATQTIGWGHAKALVKIFAR